MSIQQEDRLKAFLERNKGRLSQTNDSLNSTCFDKLLNTPSNLTMAEKNSEIDNSTKLDSIHYSTDLRSDLMNSHIQNPAKPARKNRNDTMASSAYFSNNESSDLFGNNDVRNPQATETETPYRGSVQSLRNVKNMSNKKTNKMTSSMVLDSAKGKTKIRGLSTSFSGLTWESSLNQKNPNRIENYIQSRKAVRRNLRDRVRSLSTESSTSLKPFKLSYSIINNSSTKNQPSESVSELFESRNRTPSAKSLAIEPIEPNRISKNSLSLKKEKVKSSVPFQKKSQVKTKRGSENQEFCYEEVEKSNNKSPMHNSQAKSSRSKQPVQTQSKSPLKEVQPRNRANKSSISISSTKTAASEKNTTEKMKRRERSINGNSQDMSQGESRFFPESSKKLQVLEGSVESSQKFKKEIKNLIGIIKKEKEQVTNEMSVLTKELKRYKAAYKRLKKDGDHPSSKSPEAKSRVEKDHPHSSSKKNILNERSSVTSMKESAADKTSHQLTISELTQYIESNAPVYNEENIEELLSKIDHVHSDVESILNRNENSEMKSHSGRNQDLKSFELRKTPANCAIIKEMNLPMSIFFQDFEKDESIDCKPNLIDLLSAQREVIYFLVKKLQIEEQQRLKTEEQASKMMLHMEKTVKQLEGKNNSTRRKEPFSLLDLNKSNSTISQSTYKCETPNDLI